MLTLLRYLSIALPLLVLLRLVRERLWNQRPYQAFAAFLLVGFLRDLILLKPAYETVAYSALWRYTLPPLLVGQVIAGLATYAAIANLYPGMGRFAARLFGACMLAAALAGLIILPLEIGRISAEEAKLRTLFLVQRWVATVLAGGLALAVLYLSRFPSPLRQVPRNIKLHTACVATYFASYAALYTVENTHALGGAQWAVVLQMLIVCAAYAIWAAGLSAAGQASEAWPKMDAAVSEMIDARYRAAKELMSHAAGEGRK